MSNQTINNLISIQEDIKKNNDLNKVKIVAVTKTFSMEKIKPLIDFGHIHFGENKFQEAAGKWNEQIRNNKQIKLHMIGKLQSNKAKKAVELFHYIHSVDSQKLADVLSKSEKNVNKKLNYFIQLNIGDENQKSGIKAKEAKQFLEYCQNESKINVIGLMAIPPNDNKTEEYFKSLSEINTSLNLPELSMGMSNDYLLALRYKTTFIRIGSKILGERS